MNIVLPRYKLSLCAIAIIPLGVLAYLGIQSIQSKTSIIGDRGDNLFVLSNIRYQYMTLLKNPSEIENLPIYFPLRSTLFMSDVDFVLALVYGVLHQLIDNEIQVFNLIVGALIFLGYTFTCALVYQWTGSLMSSISAALLFAFSPVVLAQVGHVNLLTIWCIPAFMLTVGNFLRTRRASAGAYMALVVCVQAYTGLYVLIQCLIAGALYFVIYMSHQRTIDMWRLLRVGALSMLLTFVVCFPLANGYLSVSQDHNIVRSIAENVTYSAELKSFLLGDGSEYVPAPVTDPGRMTDSHEKRLWPGWPSLLLGGFALIIIGRGFRNEKKDVRIQAVTAGSLVVFGCIAALGPFLVIDGRNVGIPLPYLMLLKFVPVFNAMRVPARFGILSALGLALLSGLVIAKVPLLVSRSHNKILVQLGITILIALNCIARGPVSNDNIQEIISSSGAQVVAHSLGGPAVWYPVHAAMAEPWREVPRMFLNRGMSPFVNGYSGMVPFGVFEVRRLLETEGASSASLILRTLGVRHVLFDVEMTPAPMLDDWTRLASAAGPSMLHVGTVAIINLEEQNNVNGSLSMSIEEVNIKQDETASIKLRFANAARNVWAGPEAMHPVLLQVAWSVPGNAALERTSVYATLPLYVKGQTSVNAVVTAKRPVRNGPYLLAVESIFGRASRMVNVVGAR